LWSRVRLVAVLLAAMLIAVAGCSLLAPKANANGRVKLTLTSRHETLSFCINLGKIDFRAMPATVYSLPATVDAPFGEARATFIPPDGCEFVRWEITGEGNKLAEPNSVSTRVDIMSTGTLTAIYRGGCCGVGGVVLPTNTYMTLAPYLAVIGLVAAAAVAVKRRRN